MIGDSHEWHCRLCDKDLQRFLLQQFGACVVSRLGEEGVFFGATFDRAGFDASGDVLVVKAVPPGSGRRIGIDQDQDGISDGLDPMPQHNNDGDVELDGDVDGADVQPFIAVLLNPGRATPPEFHAADVNNDDAVDMSDVQTMVLLLLTASQ